MKAAPPIVAVAAAAATSVRSERAASFGKHIARRSRSSSSSSQVQAEERFACEVKVFANIMRVNDQMEHIETDFEVYVRYSLASAGGKHLIDPSRGVQIVDEGVLANVLPIVQFYDALSCQPLTHVFAIDHETGLAYVAYNWLITFRETFRLHRFPFDSQEINLVFETVNARMCDWDAAVPDAAGVDTGPEQDVTLGVHQETWKMAALGVDRTDDDTKFDARLIICREPSFFLWNVGFVNFTLVLVSFTVSGIPPSDLADRLSVTLTCMLTSVAFKFVLISMLPVCSYLTLLDRYILASFFLLGLNALENFVVCWLPYEPAVDHEAEVAYEAASDPNQTGSNRTAASLVPLRLDTPRGFEMVFYGVMCTLWLVVHALLIFGARRGLFAESIEAVREREDEADEQEMSRSFAEQRKRQTQSSGRSSRRASMNAEEADKDLGNGPHREKPTQKRNEASGIGLGQLISAELDGSACASGGRM